MSTQKDLLEEMRRDLQAIRNSDERREEDIKNIKENMSFVKKTLLDPNDGLIVKINKNTEHREDAETDLDDLRDTIKELTSWKNTVTRVLWVIFTAMVGVITKLMFFA